MTARQTVVSFFKAHQARDEKKIAQLCANDIIVRGGSVPVTGVQAYVDTERQVWKLLGNQTLLAENVIDSGENVVVQWIEKSDEQDSKGPVTVAGCTVYKVVNGQIAEVDIYVDSSTVPTNSRP
jgi:ketosteroid isomerase-like protein